MQNKIQKLFGMKDIPRIFLADKLDPRLSLALGGVLFDSNKPSLLINRAKPSIIFGTNQNPYIECNIEQIKNDQISLIRRETGGGAVYLDNGTLMIGFNGRKDYPSYDQNNINQLITKTFNEFIKYPAEIVGKNDIKVKINNSYHKIAGQAFKYDSGYGYYKHHLSVLINTNFNAMQKYLLPNKLKIEAKGVKSVRSNVVNMKDIMHDKMVPSMNDSLLFYNISMQMIKNFMEKYEFTNRALLTVIDDTSEDTEHSYLRLVDRYPENDIFKDVTYVTTATLSSVKEISDKYRRLCDEKTVFNKTPNFTHQFEKRFDWGTITLQLDVEKNIIKNVTCYTDSIEVELPKILNLIMLGVYYNNNILGYHFDCGIESHKKEHKQQTVSILTDIKKLITGEIPR